MESSPSPWLSETELDNPVFSNQLDFMEPFDEELAAIIEGDFEGCLFPGNNSPPPTSSASIPTPPITNPISTSFSTSSTPVVLNFGHANSPQNSPRTISGHDQEAFNVSQTSSRSQALMTDPPEELPKRSRNLKRTTGVRPPSQTYDHIVAERKRREVLNRHFLALSTIVPDLKKMDKTSVLGNTITYLKNLQEKVNTLEEQATKWCMESAVLVKKSRIAVDDGEESRHVEERPLPEIETRISGTQILIRIQCENRKGLLSDLIGQVEKLNLSIVNTNVITFAMFALEITITAKMEKEFNLTMDQVLKGLRDAIKTDL